MQSYLNIWVTFILVYLYCICYKLVIVTFCLLSTHATFCFLIVSCCVHVCWLCCCWWQSFFGFHINKEFEFKVKVVFFFFFLCLRAGRCLGLWCRKQTQKNLGLEEILKKIRMQMFTNENDAISVMVRWHNVRKLKIKTFKFDVVPLYSQGSFADKSEIKLR